MPSPPDLPTNRRATAHPLEILHMPSGILPWRLPLAGPESRQDTPVRWLLRRDGALRFR